MKKLLGKSAPSEFSITRRQNDRYWANRGHFENEVSGNSDKRFKKDIRELNDPLETVERLRGVRYRWRTEEFPERGFGGGVAALQELGIADLVSGRTTQYGRLEFRCSKA